MPDPFSQWLTDHPDVQSIRTAAPDLNGQSRGKRVPLTFADKLFTGGARFPYSVLNLDIFGSDIEDSPLVFETGDADGTLRPTERGLMPMPWLGAQAAMLPISMYDDAGAPFEGDPRHALARVKNRLAARGLRPVCALEMEFYLVDDSGDALQIPTDPVSGQRRQAADTLSNAALERFEAFFDDLYAGAEAMGIPADSALSESGPGQFEINLMHCDDALLAADHAWFFKLLTKGLARTHGFAASFMAKPYAEEAGSGMHCHFSILDDTGANIFDDGTDKGSDTLRHAINGCLNAMAPSTLIFAPHANSYARLVPGAHAPTGVGWAYENRTAAIRVPAGSPKARRIEHRVAGADVNPYLLLAAILGAAMNGIEDAVLPPAPLTGNAYDHDLLQSPGDWVSATDAFETAPEVARIFHPDLIRNLCLTKRQEQRLIQSLDHPAQVEIYLDTV